MISKEGKSVVYTLAAKCRDCYRCVRKCPVKAILVKDGQAYIDEDRCIFCGTCTKECPQSAKTYRQDYLRVKEEINLGKKIIASVAPSFAGSYSKWQAARVPSILRMLGFNLVYETSEGALHTAVASTDYAAVSKGCSYCTACPAVVNYVEKYKPEKIENLVPLVSPMIAHGRLLRERYGNEAIIVFIGPCIAKKMEADRKEHAGIIDYALTFEELNKWMATESVDFINCEESPFDSSDPSGKARRFPIPGGLIYTSQNAKGSGIVESLSTSGRTSMFEVFKLEDVEEQPVLIDHLFCNEGCINGPGIEKSKSIFERRRNLIEYAKGHEADSLNDFCVNDKLRTTFYDKSVVSLKKISESELSDALELTGKRDKEAQLNCGACGYSSCIDMAEAIVNGLAEADMCIPYMRRLAEKRTDKIIETSPNGIVLINESLEIISMNPAFKKLFMCTESVLGRRISYLLDSAGYEKLVSNAVESYDSIVQYNGKIYHQLIYKLNTEKQFVGIYVDITKLRMDEKRINSIQIKGIEQAKELLEHQMRMAQDMAKFLGENTARGEELVRRLLNTYENGADK